jgi:hypothetical protein
LLLMLMVECGRDTNLIYQIFLPSDAHDIVSISLSWHFVLAKWEKLAVVYAFCPSPFV